MIWSVHVSSRIAYTSRAECVFGKILVRQECDGDACKKKKNPPHGWVQTPRHQISVASCQITTLPITRQHTFTHLTPFLLPVTLHYPPPPPHFLSFSIKIWKINSFLEFNYYFSFLYFKKSILISILLILVSLFSKCVIAHST